MFFTCHVPRKTSPSTQVYSEYNKRAAACMYVCVYGVRMNAETRHDVHNPGICTYFACIYVYMYVCMQQETE
jgi:hypothetical protein